MSSSKSLLAIVLLIIMIMLAACSDSEREELINNGLSSHDEGQLEKALDYLDQAKDIQDFSNDENISNTYNNIVKALSEQYINTGKELLREQKHESAINSFKKAKEINPEIESVESILSEEDKVYYYTDFSLDRINKADKWLEEIYQDIKKVQSGKLSHKELTSRSKDYVPKLEKMLEALYGKPKYISVDMNYLHENLVNLIAFHLRFFENDVKNQSDLDFIIERYHINKELQYDTIHDLEYNAQKHGINLVLYDHEE